MILNIAHLLLYKIMIYSFLSLPFWPGSGSANLCGSGSETLEENYFFKFLRIHTELTCSTSGATFCVRVENNFLLSCFEFIVSCLTIHQEPEPEPKLRIFFGSGYGSGYSKKNRLRLRNTGLYMTLIIVY